MPGYSSLDLLSNLGGLAFFLLALGSVIVGAVYANQAQTHLVEHLFAYEDQEEQAKQLQIKTQK